MATIGLVAFSPNEDAFPDDADSTVACSVLLLFTVCIFEFTPCCEAEPTAAEALG